jgi:hypothetical protein
MLDEAPPELVQISKVFFIFFSKTGVLQLRGFAA